MIRRHDGKRMKMADVCALAASGGGAARFPDIYRMHAAVRADEASMVRATADVRAQ
jgi:hypothetical protein